MIEEKDLNEAVEKRLKELLGFVDSKHILTLGKTSGFIFIGGERVSDERLSNLRSEAQFLLQSDLWKILHETIKHMAYEMMFVKSQKYEDVQSGKMWLYHIDTQKKIMDTLKSYTPKKIVDKVK